MKKWMVLILILGLILPQAYAKPPEGKGPPHKMGGSFNDKGFGKRSERVKNTVLDEVEDAVMDELVGKSSGTSSFRGGDMPPGLAKKGKMPPGLAKKGKTPPGWEKANFGAGRKGKPEKKEGLIRKWVGRLFGRGKKEQVT